MPVDDQKDVNKIKDELKKEYESGNRDRELALSLLSSRLRKDDESLQDYAFHIAKLVRLAYPSFNDDTRDLHEKDYFVRGLHPDLQLKVKTLEKFAELKVKDLIDNAVRLEIAGVGSSKPKVKSEVLEVRECPHHKESESNNITLDKLQNLEEMVAKLSVSGKTRGRGRRFDGRNTRNFNNGNSGDKRKCWNCGDTAHLLRSCPKRFCQSCGKVGHDAWSTSCPNHS